MYKIKARGDVQIKVEKIYYNKDRDIFTFIVPALHSIIFEDFFTLHIKDEIAESSSIEYCKVIDKKYSNNKCKISFVVKSKGARSLQDTIANQEYWEAV